MLKLATETIVVALQTVMQANQPASSAAPLAGLAPAQTLHPGIEASRAQAATGDAFEEDNGQTNMREFMRHQPRRLKEDLELLKMRNGHYTLRRSWTLCALLRI